MDFKFQPTGAANTTAQNWHEVVVANGEYGVTKLSDGEYRLDLENLSNVNQEATVNSS